MTGIEWSVLLVGIALIAWINWYFFIAGKGTAVTAMLAGGVQEVTVIVQGGYSPSEVRAVHGQALRMVFVRQETSGCSEEIVLPEFGIRKFLPPFQKTAVEIHPAQAGSFEFTCGMGMLRGKLIVE